MSYPLDGGRALGIKTFDAQHEATRRHRVSLVNDAARRRALRDSHPSALDYVRYDEPWHRLPLPDQKALERAARALLLATLPPATADLVRRGRCPQVIAAEMRRMSARLPDAPAVSSPTARPPQKAAPPTNADADTWDII